MRSPQEILECYEKATKDAPIILAADEAENFSKAMKILGAKYAVGNKKCRIEVIKDIEPYRNTLDGKPIGSRREHREFLKRNGCVEVGNDFNNTKSPKEVRGDFNVRPELSRAVHQVLNK